MRRCWAATAGSCWALDVERPSPCVLRIQTRLSNSTRPACRARRPVTVIRVERGSVFALMRGNARRTSSRPHRRHVVGLDADAAEDPHALERVAGSSWAAAANVPPTASLLRVAGRGACVGRGRAPVARSREPRDDAALRSRRSVAASRRLDCGSPGFSGPNPRIVGEAGFEPANPLPRVDREITPKSAFCACFLDGSETEADRGKPSETDLIRRVYGPYAAHDGGAQ